MTKRFTAQHTASGYAAMGKNMARPHIAGVGKSKGDIKAAIEAERRKAQRILKATGK